LKYIEAGFAIHNEPIEKGQEKKTLVLTLGSPSEKGGKNIFLKKPWYYPWAAHRKRPKKKKKNPGINPGQCHLKYTEAGSAIE
jgi:hypothetical protein